METILGTQTTLKDSLRAQECGWPTENELNDTFRDFLSYNVLLSVYFFNFVLFLFYLFF